MKIGTTVLVGEEGLFAHGVEAAIFGAVEVPGVVELLQDGLHDGLVPRFRGADEIIDGELERAGEVLPILGEFIAVGLRGLAFLVRDLLHLLPVLIEAGEEEYVFTHTAPGARDHVADDLLVGMPEVRLAVDVVDGGGDVVTLAHLRGTVAQGGGNVKRKT